MKSAWTRPGTSWRSIYLRGLLPHAAYFVALPFDRNEEGELVAGEAQDRQSASAAESAARRMADTAAGAVAFSRTGDPASSEFEDAVVLRELAEVPSIEELLRCSAQTKKLKSYGLHYLSSAAQ